MEKKEISLEARQAAERCIEELILAAKLRGEDYSNLRLGGASLVMQTVIAESYADLVRRLQDLKEVTGATEYGDGWLLPFFLADGTSEQLTPQQWIEKRKEAARLNRELVEHLKHTMQCFVQTTACPKCLNAEAAINSATSLAAPSVEQKEGER